MIRHYWLWTADLSYYRSACLYGCCCHLVIPINKLLKLPGLRRTFFGRSERRCDLSSAGSHVLMTSGQPLTWPRRWPHVQQWTDGSGQWRVIQITWRHSWRNETLLLRTDNSVLRHHRRNYGGGRGSVLCTDCWKSVTLRSDKLMLVNFSVIQLSSKWSHRKLVKVIEFRNLEKISSDI